MCLASQQAEWSVLIRAPRTTKREWQYQPYTYSYTACGQQEDKVKVSLGYITRFCVKTNEQNPPSGMVWVYYLSTGEAERSYVQSQPGLHAKALSLKNKTKHYTHLLLPQTFNQGLYSLNL